MKYTLLLTLFSLNVFAGIKEDVTQVMKLREEVEVLSSEVEMLKKSNQSEVDVYLGREQEVTASLLKEKFKNDQIKLQISTGKQKIEKMSKKNLNSKVENFLTSFWEKYENSLNQSNPVISTKLKERLNKLKFDYFNKRISYEHSLIQTWFLLEDDFKSSKEADFTISQVNFNDKDYHLELVRMGRSLAYFRTAEGSYGKLTSYPYLNLEFYKDSKSVEMIELLIKQFKQQSKTGLYSLPGINL